MVAVVSRIETVLQTLIITLLHHYLSQQSTRASYRSNVGEDFWNATRTISSLSDSQLSSIAPPPSSPSHRQTPPLTSQNREQQQHRKKSARSISENPVVSRLKERSPHPFSSLALSPRRHYAITACKDTLQVIQNHTSGSSTIQTTTGGTTFLISRHEINHKPFCHNWLRTYSKCWEWYSSMVHATYPGTTATTTTTSSYFLSITGFFAREPNSYFYFRSQFNSTCSQSNRYDSNQRGHYRRSMES